MGPRSRLVGPLALSLLFANSSASAQAPAPADPDFFKRCGQWVAKRGYTRDYIEMKTGVRPPQRTQWRDNIRPDELQPGDVVLLKLWPGHLALVEEVERDADGKPSRLTVNGYNYGAGKPFIDKECEVSANFGVEVRHVVTMGDTSGYWRPTKR